MATICKSTVRIEGERGYRKYKIFMGEKFSGEWFEKCLSKVLRFFTRQLKN